MSGSKNTKAGEKMIKRRIFRTILITVAVVLTALIGMFATDKYCTGHLMKPVFAKPVTVTTGYGEGHDVYKGIGYTVEAEIFINKNGDKKLIAVTMYVGDKTVSASIS